ncbi:hypothetical protein LOTGIDRAFT_168383 [Lottia gigantea]|uniref:Uncharacterized protein n=1 Tax=Lottia gigantea TaxID=225164 RepID=V4B7U6_LOTGI|nr:hypothetical protein LOTGIDRAFT_168383 [Lottia gigantea]ESO84719.1 hypothetical protein LOTGIDRAFT_168383 [Lottia gigantea]
MGKNANNVIPDHVKNGIREHINSIPRLESHYCRASTNKEYLPNGLSIALLYDKYAQRCREISREPAKLHMYRHIFNNEFNIGFHMPKKDRCDACESMKMNENPTELERITHLSHIQGKESTKSEREKDRNNSETFTICFDLQNVFALPTADVSNFFYRRKLNVYHMTAHCSADKRGYGAVWHEGQSGRSGNDIASSVVRILDSIYEFNSSDPRIQNITLWSDSCVPQNKNRVMSTAIKLFLKNHPDIKTIIHKYSQPGHSSIQEVDNLHSQIERVCRNIEIYSPVGLLRLLKKVKVSKPLNIIQMKPEYFKDYLTIANTGQFQNIPFTKVKCLLYEQYEPKILRYKKGFDEEWITENVFERQWSRSGITSIHLGEPKSAKSKPLTQVKIQDIKAMLKFMPPSDRAYMYLQC